MSNMKSPRGSSRRNFLRGVGVCMALPALESLRSSVAVGASTAGQMATTATGAPLRTAFIYFPNGAIPGAWWPTGTGADFVLSKTLAPLEPVRDKIQVVRGLDHLNAIGGADGGGDHARANSVFLTGVRLRKSRIGSSRRGFNRPGSGQALRRSDPLCIAGDELRRRSQGGRLRHGLFVRTATTSRGTPPPPRSLRNPTRGSFSSRLFAPGAPRRAHRQPASTPGRATLGPRLRDERCTGDDQSREHIGQAEA